MTQQERILNSNPDVLIATPGRLLDLCERQKVMLFGIRYVVIDEADRMLDMGFLPDVKRIMEKIPLSRQTMLFSATFDDEIRKLTHQFMLAPKIVNISRAGSTVDSIEQYFVMAGDKQKRIITRHIIQTYGKNTENKVPTIIFCNRKTQVTTLVSSLRRHKFAADSLHGDLQQSTRNQTVERFRSGEIHVLVASDIAARGLDVADLGLVINFDVPVNAEDYVHRIGRTGRAGKSGFAFTLIEKRDQKQWKAIEKLTEQQIREFVVPEELFEVKQQVKNTAEKKEKLDKSEVVAESLEQHVRLIPDNNKRRRPLRSPRIMQKNTAVVSVDVLCENNGYDRTEVFDKTKNVKTDSYQPKNNLNTDGLFLNKNKTLGFGEEPPAFFKQDSYRKFLTTDNLTSDLFIHNNEEASKSHEKNNTPKQNEAPI
jgi:superfamily II DNA/RNA helicase